MMPSSSETGFVWPTEALVPSSGDGLRTVRRRRRSCRRRGRDAAAGGRDVGVPGPNRVCRHVRRSTNSNELLRKLTWMRCLPALAHRCACCLRLLPAPVACCLGRPALPSSLDGSSSRLGGLGFLRSGGGAELAAVLRDAGAVGAVPLAAGPIAVGPIAAAGVEPAARRGAVDGVVVVPTGPLLSSLLRPSPDGRASRCSRGAPVPAAGDDVETCSLPMDLWMVGALFFMPTCAII